MNNQNTNRFIDTENRLLVARGVMAGKKGEVTEKCKLAVTKWSQRCKLQHRKYSR